MNILYIAPDIPIPHSNMFVGGTTHVLELSRALKKLGNSITILSRRNKYQPEYEELSGIKIYRIYRGLIFPVQGSPSVPDKPSEPSLVIKSYFSLIYKPALILKTINIIIKEKIDAVIDRNSSYGIGTIAAYLCGIPSYLEVIDPNYSNLSLKLSKKIFTYTPKIIPEAFHDKTIITTAGVDLNKFNTTRTKDIRSKYNLHNKKVLIYVGEDSAWHGVNDIISLSTLLPPEIIILLVGKNLEKYANNTNIICPGFIPHSEVKNYILASDICLAPYNPKNTPFLKNSFCFSPIKIFEYMACGKPIITSCISIIDDIILNNSCGILYPPGNINSLKFAVINLLNNKDEMEELSQNALNAVKNYTWNKVAEQINSEMMK